MATAVTVKARCVNGETVVEREVFEQPFQ